VEITKKLPRQQLNLAAVIIAIWSITATWSFMNAHANFLRDWSASLRAELSALEDHKQFADPNYFPDTLRAPDISVKKYFAATAALESSPAQEFSSLSTTSNSVRTEVDRVLLQSGALVVGELSQSNKGCSPELDASDYLVLNKSSVFISSPDGEIEIGFRRFADEPNSALRTVIAEGAQVSITTQKMSDVNFWTVVSLTPNKRVCVSLSSD
jgi:D-serine deaminase-like pyridoxal phosphate-dependent protein